MKTGMFIDLSKGKGNVEEPNLRRSARILNKILSFLKKGKVIEKDQPMFKKRTPNQDGASVSKGKLGTGTGSQIIKPTCSSCEKRNYGECIFGF